MPVYSHSKLSSFENCPLHYRFRYIDRLPAGFESVEAFMGKRVHEILHEIYADLPTARSAGAEPYLQSYERLWEKTFSGFVRVIRPDLDADHYRRLGARCLAGYWDRNHPFLVEPSQIIGLEMKIEATLDSAGRHRMIGYVDRVQHAGPGVIEIHDYKTTATLPKEGSLRWDRQLPLYEIALRQRFPETKEVRLIWHFLVHRKEAVEKRTREDLDWVRRKSLGLIRAVEEAREFPSKKGPLCAWCEYQDVCPEWKRERPAAPPAFPDGRPIEDQGADGPPAVAPDAASDPAPTKAPEPPSGQRRKSVSPGSPDQLSLF